MAAGVTAPPSRSAAAEFFGRYPALHGFLLGQLREAAAQLEARSAAGGGGGGGVAHPGLYPVLIILSRLRPSHLKASELPAAATALPEPAATDAATNPAAADTARSARVPPSDNTAAAFLGGLSPAAFTPLVRRCATAAPLAVRRLAARALVPLLPPAEVPPLLQQLLAAVPPAPPSAAAADASQQPRAPPPNVLHGSLLQAAALLGSGSLAMTPARSPSYALTASTAGSSDQAGQDDDGRGAVLGALRQLARGAWMADPASGEAAQGAALLAASSAALGLLPAELCGEVSCLAVGLAVAYVFFIFSLYLYLITSTSVSVVYCARCARAAGRVAAAVPADAECSVRLHDRLS
jgi:hypothetical protein